MSGDRITLPSGMYMKSFKFGYIVTGRCPEVDNMRHNNPCTLFVAVNLNRRSNQGVECSVKALVTRNPTLENFWNLETIDISDPIRADSDDDVLTRFSETIEFKDNWYQVTWPWKADISLP